MKRILFSIIGVCLLCFATAKAEVPREMTYQIMVLNPQTGKVKTNENVTIRMELRQGSQSGKSVWSQEFNTQTDNSGICQLTLNFTDDIKWDDDKYYLASIVDGNECGAPKMTSVPYALKAASIEGIITKSELIGTWKASYSDKGTQYSTTYTFYENGTARYLDVDYETDDRTFNWYMNATGTIALVNVNDNQDCLMMHAVKLNDNQIVFGGEDGYDSRIFTKQ